MIIILDINVLLDVFIIRQPHYASSAHTLSLVTERKIKGIVSAHSVTTLYYLARRQSDLSTAEAAVDHVIQHCEIASLDNAGWKQARGLGFVDFEDAVIATLASETHCDFIVTRNIADFRASRIPAISPMDFLCSFPI